MHCVRTGLPRELEIVGMRVYSCEALLLTTRQVSNLSRHYKDFDSHVYFLRGIDDECRQYDIQQ